MYNLEFQISPNFADYLLEEFSKASVIFTTYSKGYFMVKDSEVVQTILSDYQKEFGNESVYYLSNC